MVDKVPEGNYFLMGGSPVDNNAKLFRAGQMKVLKPYIDSGKINVVGDQWVDGWLPENALKIMENALTANNNKIDAVVASNDATAGGAIQALSAQGLSGKVAISGQDADLAGIKRIVAGTQTMTVYKPITLLANTAAEIAVELGNGQQPKADATLNNGLKDVPSRLLTPIDVNKTNIDETVIKDGFHKRVICKRCALYNSGGRQTSMPGSRIGLCGVVMPYLLEMKNITKTFGAVKAVDNVSLRLNAGEIVSLCGENGSGKSTLMKVLCGIYPHGSYEGEILFAGETLQASHIRDTERKGIAIIHQELALVKHLTVLENIFLGSEITRNGILDYDMMTLRCQKLLDQVSLSISPDTRVGDLGLGQQQLVEIAKALNKQVRLLILDEPTASLTEQETTVLLEIIRDLQQHDIACIYISHKLNEVKAISDTICVIRDGQHIGTRAAAGMEEDDIITMMVGRELTALYPNEPHATGEEILRVERLTAWHPVNRHIKRVNDVSFSLKRGEILGIAGLVGAGRTG